ncbi:hypothetical protein MRX96_025795 [Rhipicephalus microplus]
MRKRKRRQYDAAKHPSTETFGEQAGWSSPRERDSDSALVLSVSCTPEEKVAPQRSGPRLILSTPSLLAATRTLTSPAWLSSPSDEEQPLPIPLEYDGGSLPVVTEPRLTWRLSPDPLGSGIAQNVSTLVRQLQRLASGYAEGASNDTVAENLTHGTVLVDQMVEAVPVGGDEQPLIMISAS